MNTPVQKFFYEVRNRGAEDGVFTRNLINTVGSFMNPSLIQLVSFSHDIYSKNARRNICFGKLFTFQVLLSGELLLVIQGKQHRMQRGDVLFLRPKDVVEVRGNGQCESAELIAISFNAGLHLIAIESNPALAQGNLHHLKNIAEIKNCLDKMENMIREQIAGKIEYSMTQLRLSVLCYELFALLLHEVSTRPDDRLEEITSYLMQNIHVPISMKEIEQKFKIERHTLSKLLREKNKNSPMKFFRILRLEYSSRLLKYSGEAIENIASHCGFTDTPTYSKLFRNYYGLSPSAYRKKFTKSAFLSQGNENNTVIKNKKKECQNQIMSLLSRNPHISRHQLAESTGLTLRGVDWNLRVLKESGRLIRIGSARNGRWQPTAEFRL